MERFWIRSLCLALIALSTTFPVSAQYFDEQLEEENGDPGDGDGSVPIDGGVSLLLAAGAAYGAYRLRADGAKRVKGTRDVER